MRLERRERTSIAAVALAPLAAVAVALTLCAGLIALAGVNPLLAYGEMLRGAFGSRLSLTETLTRATPLILTGLAAAVAFRARLWNIGAEGQFYVGALGTAWLGNGLLSGLPPWLAPGLHNFAGSVGAMHSFAGTAMVCGLLADGTRPADLWRAALPVVLAALAVGWAAVALLPALV